MWKATANASRVEDYVRHFTEQVAPALAAVRGYRGAQVLSNPGLDPTDVVVVTWWDSLDAIHRFAGSDIGRAVIDPRAREVLLSCDESVTHYTVVAEHATPAPR